MERLLHDIRLAVRSLLRTPGFTCVALLTLVLGIGANTAIFTIVNGVLLRELPYRDPDRLVRLYEASPRQGLQTTGLSFPDFEDWRAQTRSFKTMSASLSLPVILSGRGEPAELRAAYVTGDFFSMLLSVAQVGRVFNAEDVQQASHVAVISERLWRTHFSSAPAVVGISVVLRGQPHTVIGVLPRDFRYPASETDIWMPESVLTAADIGTRPRRLRFLAATARLADGVTLEQARTELNAVAARLASEYPDSNAEWTAATIIPLRTAIVGDVNRALVVVLGVVGFILLIGCANLANLLLARGTARANEIAVRTALGAGRWIIVRQLLTESVTLGLVGGVFALVVSVWGVGTVLALSADTLPRVEDVHLDWRVIIFALTLSLLTGLVFGLVPALKVAGTDPQRNLNGVRGAVSPSGQRMRRALVVVQVGLAVVLVIGAALMARSFLQLRGTDSGINPERMLAMTLQLNVSDFTGPSMGRELGRRRREILDKLATIPQVASVGAINSLPFQKEGWEYVEFRRADAGDQANQGSLRADSAYVSAGYLRTMGIPLLRGELLPEGLWPPGTPTPILINNTAARRFWPEREAVGQIINGSWGGQARIVGVVGDVRQLGLAEEMPPAVFFPQVSGGRSVTTFVIRSANDPLQLIGSIRRAIRELNPNQPIRSIATMSGVMADSIARDRFFTVLYAFFGGLALVLAAVGVYGVLAYSVGQRTEEIGLRMALGARTSDVLRLIVGGGMTMVLAGVATGGLASLVLSRALRSQLHGVSATDPVAFVVAPILLTVVALVACYIPARRAMRINPVSALREQ